MAARYDFTAYNNEDFDLTLGIYQSGDYVSATGYTGILQARTSAGATGIAFGSASGTVAMATGSMAIHISKAVMTNVDPGSYDYDLLLSGNATVRRLLYGIITVNQGVTR